MAGKIETWLIVQSGARITADGHLQVRTTAGPGAWQNVGLTAGTYKTFADAAQELEDELNNDAAAVGVWTVTASGDSVTIACTAAFDLTWYDEEVKEYFGYGAEEVTNQTSLVSDELPRGRITLNHEMDIDYFIIVPHRHAQDHASRRYGTAYDLRHGQTCRLLVDNTEAAHMHIVLQRLQQGYPARVWLDSSLSGTFDWTNADWKKGRDLALQDTGGVVSFNSWITVPTAYHRSVELRMVEAG